MQEAAASARQVGELQAWRNLLKPQYRPQAVLAVAIPTFQQWTGINRCGWRRAPALVMQLTKCSASCLQRRSQGLSGVWKAPRRHALPT